MNDAMTAAKGSEDSTEAQDFVELGQVSTETQGSFFGFDYDGNFGWWNG
jgi:hypothetical protein